MAEQQEQKVASFTERGAISALQAKDTAERPAPGPKTPVAPPSSAPPPGPDAAPEAKAKPRSWKRSAGLVIAPLVLIAAGLYGYNYWTFGRFQISTDDAYIGADIATVSAKVSGYVTSVEVTDNSEVRTGDVIARIDDGDYRLAVQTAKDKIAIQQSTIERIARQITAQAAAVDQARAQLVSADAEAKRAKLELDRQQNLATRDFGSRQTLEGAEATAARAEAAVLGNKAAIEAAIAQGEVLKAEKAEAEGTLAQLQTALAMAERDLSFTTIKAPFDGVIGNRAVQKGDYLQPSARLASLVPLDRVYIDANFKETQLARLRPGQEVGVEVDAMPGHVFHGKVVSFSPASGQIFSLLPPENATGNFTKIVQRLPVRIEVEQREGEHGVLRPGMSVIVRVNTLDAPAGQPLFAEAKPASPSGASK
ncbi:MULTISPECIES: HlyD family secretion protein [Rhodomicrobium]|uniref:HlyD family secretion protein n=1 Tax=Rhodomicrobium TaxID=1068 RepID=UPI001FDAB925|nr:MULTISPECIES: HlyD family secretion protein [Rhodomicrobium]